MTAAQILGGQKPTVSLVGKASKFDLGQKLVKFSEQVKNKAKEVKLTKALSKIISKGPAATTTTTNGVSTVDNPSKPSMKVLKDKLKEALGKISLVG